MTRSGRIRVGIGGWTYAPWRGDFYPKGWPAKRELEYASRHVSAIEINGTFYRTQRPESYVRWREETPGDFVFTVKAPRYATHRTELSGAADAVARFMDSGVLALGPKLGAILWQLAPTKRFDAEELEAFLALLPHGVRHALDAPHRSYACETVFALARKYHVAVAHTDADGVRAHADVTGGLVYVRLKRGHADIPTGYAPDALDEWAQRARAWSCGDLPADLPALAPRTARHSPRDVYLYVINGAKERAPAAAQALLARLR